MENAEPTKDLTKLMMNETALLYRGACSKVSVMRVPGGLLYMTVVIGGIEHRAVHTEYVPMFTSAEYDPLLRK